MEHIKLQDLSIGNWVEYDREYYRVIQIDEESQHVIISGLSGVRDKHIDYIEPIHIKPEMLERNGFVLTGYGNKYDVKNYAWSEVRLHGNDGLWQCRIYQGFYDDCVIQMRYLHQLQNALRLVGVNKEIEL